MKDLILSKTKDRIQNVKEKLPDFTDKRVRFKLAAAVLVMAVLLTAFSCGYWYVTQPSFCGSCHETKAEYVSWTQSIHAEVDCGECHGSGFLGFEKVKMGAIDITKHLLGSYKLPINKDSELSKYIPSSACLKCHAPGRVVSPRNTIVMKHKIHIDDGIGCAVCHNRVGHDNMGGYESQISMKGCFRCHGLAKTSFASGSCSLCHPKTFNLIPPQHRTATWLIPDHGKSAKTDRSKCLTCHQEKFCTNCHGIDIPHNKKFVKTDHNVAGRIKPQTCRKCHRQQDFCSACHHKDYKNPQGGWLLYHQNVVHDNGVSYCFNCHGPTFCAKCHVTGKIN
jgi:hypothetical protein